jgi:DNA polymerase-3 subunit gamma/tau
LAYQVLARRWRPQKFEDVVGQDHVVRTLQNAISSGRIAHAYLFTGVRGVGKTSIARILAKALNCEKGPTPTPDNSCSICNEITAGTSVDVLEIDGASNTGVDDVRELRENVRYMPQSSRYKIYIIDEVHMLSNAAFNALLKTLEEPPPHIIFIFATTEPQKIPATILSRCQRFDFKRIPREKILESLKQISISEGVTIEESDLRLIAREAEGSMRDALSLLDQVISFAGKMVPKGEVQKALGIIDRTWVTEMAQGIIDRDSARALEVLAKGYEHGYDLKQMLKDLIAHFRNMAITRAVANPTRL